MLMQRAIRPIKYGAAVFVCAVLPWNATAVNHGSITQQYLSAKAGHGDTIDSMLVKGLLEIGEGNTKQALGTINELIRKVPNFKLAYLIRGDLLTSQGNAISGFGNQNTGLDTPSSNDQVEGLREEALTRVRHYFSGDKIPTLSAEFFALNPSQQHVIVVDTGKSRLFLYQKDGKSFKYVADYYVTIGKNGADKKTEGDKRTPLGLYFAGAKLTKPLDPFYGDGAFPLNYPNELDIHQNRSGSGIWLHGTPRDTYSRPPRASDGCVVLSNPDLNALAPALQHGNTPVLITDNAEQLSSKLAALNTDELIDAMEAWRKDWVSQDTDAYLSHYSKRFFYSDGGLQKWGDYKRGIQASKPKVSIVIENISMLSYPGAAEGQVVIVNFEQDFRSASLQNKMRKRQYWVLEDKQWKILYEGGA